MLIAGSALLAATLFNAGQAAGPIDWLQGNWVCRAEMLAGGPVLRSENWERDDWDGLNVIVRAGLARSGSSMTTIAMARFLAIDAEASLSYWTQGGPVHHYRLVSVDDHQAVFETVDAGIPERIAYRRGPVSLTVTHSRRNGGEAQSWTLAPEGIHTGIRDC